MKSAVIITCMFLHVSCLGQTNSPNVYSVGKPNYDFSLSRDSAIVQVELLDQNQALIKVDVSVVIDNDTLSLTLKDDGLRTFQVRCGVRKLHFISKLGYELTTAYLKFPSQSVTDMKIMLEGKPILIDHIFYDL